MPRHLYLSEIEMPAQSGHIPSLDGLRACSILIVLLSHFVNANLIPGGLGVYVFFVISGVDRRTKEVRPYFAGEFLFTQSPSPLPGGVGLYRDRSRRGLAILASTPFPPLSTGISSPPRDPRKRRIRRRLR